MAAKVVQALTADPKLLDSCAASKFGDILGENPLPVDPNELFDVVDEHDRVIGQATRGEVHARGLLHRAVHVFVFDSTGRLLLQKRAATKDEFPLTWTSSASGHVDSGEDYDTAVVRELEEELGLTGELKQEGKFAACADTSNEHVVLYSMVTDAPITADPDEIAECEFAGLPAIGDRIDRDPDTFAPSFRLLFEWFLARDQPATCSKPGSEL